MSEFNHTPNPEPIFADPGVSGKNTQAVTGFVFSILGLLTCGLLSIFGVIFSALGIRREPKGLAIAGLIISLVGLVVILPTMGIMTAIAVPSFLRAREISRRNACQENMSKIDGAKQQWALENDKYEDAVPTWDELVGNSSYIRKMPVCPSGGKYIIGSIDQYPGCTMSTQASFPHVFPSYDW